MACGVVYVSGLAECVTRLTCVAAPHVDVVETYERGLDHLADSLVQGVCPSTVCLPIPVLLSGYAWMFWYRVCHSSSAVLRNEAK
jgi:hypothetical protein